MPRTNTTDIKPAFTYQWANAEQTTLKRTDADGTVTFVPADEGNRDYRAYLASGEEAAPYIAPPEPAPETTEQKVNRLLSDYGLTREEMAVALQVKTGKGKK